MGSNEYGYTETILMVIGVVLIVFNCLVISTIDSFLRELRNIFLEGVVDVKKEAAIKEVVQEIKKKDVQPPLQTFACGHYSGTYSEFDNERKKTTRCIICRTIINKDNGL